VNVTHTRSSRSRWRRWLIWLALICAGVPVVQVAALRFIDPPRSMMMLERQREARQQGDDGNGNRLRHPMG